MRFSFRTVALIGAAALVVAVVAVVVALATIDADRLVPLVAERVKAATGRDLAVRGGVSLHWGHAPKLELRDVSLGNPSWARSDKFVAAKRVQLEVALWPLLHRRVEVRQIALVEPVIDLEADAQGRATWQFGSGGGAAATAPSAPDAGSVAVSIRNLHIEQGTVHYRGAGEATPLVVRIDRLAMKALELEAPLELQVAGSAASVAFDVKVKGGSIGTLAQRNAPYALSIDGEIAGRKAKLDTKIAFADKRVRLDPLAATFGESTVTGALDAIDGNGRRRYVIDLTSPRLRVADLSLAAAARPSPQPAAKSEPPASGSRVIPDAPLPIGNLPAVPVEGKLAIGELLLPGDVRAQSLRLAFALASGRFEATQLEALVWGGKVEGRATLDARSEPPRIEVHLAARDVDLGTAMRALGSPREVRGGKTGVRLDASARGTSLHAWASTATGNVEIVTGPASIAKGDATSPVTRLSAAVNPLYAKQNITDLKCAVARTPIANGIARFERTVAVETDVLGATASGTIDFGKETIDASVHPSFRQGVPIDIGQVAGLVRLRGDWRDPKVSVDAAGSVSTVARLGAVVAGGGLPALGGLFVLGSATENGPCAEALGAPRKTDRDKPPPPAHVDPTQELFKGLGRLLR